MEQERRHLMGKGPTWEFGQRIRRYREERGWSITEAAQRMKIQRTSLSRWENGHEMPCGENMSKLHDHLRMPVSRVEGPQDITLEQLPETGYQLVLPFNQRIHFDLEVVPRKTDAIGVRFRLKQAN